jgi:hypothetical protein
VLVAALVGAGVLAASMAALRAGERTLGRVSQQARELERAHAVPALLREQIMPAGVDMTACGVAVSGDGSVLELRQGGVPAVRILAGRDAARRPALYLQTLPHARQPWIADIEGFRVVSFTTPAGTVQVPFTRASSRPETGALSLELLWNDGFRSQSTHPLPAAPCLEVLP